ncbi:hypothetical protein AAFF_G00136130 [Aldrovandia affinis]|uniref:Uncharacterized protein n=1 Tax=Aldrovandia affinis TaxID=143900 RepID=A0AAD7W8X7_9TELE|nr:hypothetical protein AAFF_G00136130 [Aldrovandia affinis]
MDALRMVDAGVETRPPVLPALACACLCTVPPGHYPVSPPTPPTSNFQQDQDDETSSPAAACLASPSQLLAGASPSTAASAQANATQTQTQARAPISAPGTTAPRQPLL